MEQQYNDNGSITVRIDGAKLIQMEQMDLVVFHTPGSSRIYIDGRPQFQDDYCVIDCQDILDALGYDASDGLTADDVAEITVEVA